MPHQDKDDLRTPLAELKALVRPFCDLDLGSVHRHGNAQPDQVGAVIMVLLTFRRLNGAIHFLFIHFLFTACCLPESNWLATPGLSRSMPHLNDPLAAIGAER